MLSADDDILASNKSHDVFIVEGTLVKLPLVDKDCHSAKSSPDVLLVRIQLHRFLNPILDHLEVTIGCWSKEKLWWMG
jgi:hypothetical protein